MTHEPVTPAGLAGAVDLSALVQRAEQRGAQPAAPGGAAPGGAPDAGTPADDADLQARAQAAAAGEAAVATLPDAVIEGDEQALQEFVQLSQFLPVIVEMHAKWSSEAQALSHVLAPLVRAKRGRLVLVRIDLDAHPSLGQQPQVIGILAGRPLQLFSGNPPQEQVAQLLDEVLQVAEQQGLRGYVDIIGQGDEADGADAQQPTEPELPPLHKEAFEAVERGDYDAGIAAFDRAIAQNPADDDARAGRAQVLLLKRLQGHSLSDIRAAAASAPDDLDAQLLVADLDVSGGHVDDAFDRLLTLFPSRDADERTRIRERLLELFLLVGVNDPRVGKARARLTNLLF